MALFLAILAFVSIISTQSETFDTTEDKIQQQIDAAIKFMCINQFESNGQFTYQIDLKSENIEIDIKDNNAARQGGGLYAIGMYYRLNHQRHNHKLHGFSITDCIDNQMRYLTSASLPIVFASDDQQILNDAIIEERGTLYNGNAGATSLALAGLIEICIVGDHACQKHIHQFKLWIKGIITMRNHKLITIDENTLKEGAFAKKLTETESWSAYFDSESYLALSRMLQYKQYLIKNIDENCELWQEILDIVNGLDEYYIEYNSEDDTHWLIQAWYNRWVILNKNNDAIDNFMNHYMIEILMKNKLKTRLNMTTYHGPRCSLVEAFADVTYAVKMMIKYSRYNNDKTDELYVFNDTLWNHIETKYKLISALQMFENKVDVYFEKIFDGGFVSAHDDKRLRIDDTQHCVCALMKIKALVRVDDKKHDSDSYSYMDYNDPVIDDGIQMGWSNVTDYDIMISIVCLVIVILIVSIIFFYWCYYYPKEQKQRNNLFWLGQTIESAASDVNNAESEAA